MEEEDDEGSELRVDLVMWLNYFKTAKRQSVQWHVQDFVNGKAFRLFSKEPAGSEIRGYYPAKFFKSVAPQSPPKNCHAAIVGKIVMCRLISHIILASVVNASSRRCRGLISVSQVLGVLNTSNI